MYKGILVKCFDMEIKRITDLIEKFAPLELQEEWDCSGWGVNAIQNQEIKKVLFCLSVTQNIIKQAVTKNCDMIISHHPLFFIPFEFNKNIPIYSAHTNLDKADGGTTDTLIELLGFPKAQKVGDFLRLVELEEEITIENFAKIIKEKLNLNNIRIVNNFCIEKVQKIAFCAGSGADFVGEAEKIGAQVIVTGDVKYHTALESNVIIMDIGHFESEYPVLKKIKSLLKPLGIEVEIADEKSPFITC